MLKLEAKMLETQKDNSRMVFDIPVDKIDKPYGIRHYYDPDAMKDLSNSIGDSGLMQPVLVVKSNKPDRYNLVVGSRRLKGTMAKGQSTIRGMLLSDRTTVEIKVLAFSENIHRAGLTPFEEAWAVFDLVKNEGLGIIATAEALKKSEQWVRRKMKYLSVPEEVKKMVVSGKLGFGHVDALVSMVTNSEEQIKFATEAVFHRFDTDELRQYIHAHTVEGKSSGNKSLQPIRKSRSKNASTEAQMLATTKNMSTQKVLMRLRLIKRTIRVIFSTFSSRKPDDIINLIVEMKNFRNELDKQIKKAEDEYGYLLSVP